MPQTVTKKELVEHIAQTLNHDVALVRDILQATFDALSEYLVEGRRIELRNFGVFSVKRRRPRVGRNPNKPEIDIKIPAVLVPVFKPGKLLKQRVRKGKA
ncbi:MAG: integration host factor subunit beta [bacterium]|nr:integration host factor subunit beta [bacterium]